MTLASIRQHFRGYTGGAGKDVLDLCDAHEALIAALRETLEDIDDKRTLDYPRLAEIRALLPPEPQR